MPNCLYTGIYGCKLVNVNPVNSNITTFLHGDL